MTRFQDIVWPPDEPEHPTAREELAQQLYRELWISRAIAHEDAQSRKELRRERRERKLYPWLFAILAIGVLIWLILVPVPL